MTATSASGTAPAPRAAAPAGAERARLPRGRALAAVAGYRLRATWRRRLPGYLALVLLTGLLGGVALASVTAARRTDSSYPDLLARTRTSGLLVTPDPARPRAFAAQLAALPGVRAAPWAMSLASGILGPDGRPLGGQPADIQLEASPDGLFTRQDGMVLLHGRPARGGSQVIANTQAAAELHLHAGSRLRLDLFTNAGTTLSRARVYRRISLTVTGIGVPAFQLVQDDIDRGRTALLAGGPDLARRFGRCCYDGLTAGLQTTGPVTAAERGYARLLATSRDLGPAGAPFQMYVTPAIEAQAQRAIRPEAIALAVFGLLAGLAAVLIGAQAGSRQLLALASDADVLRALGTSPAVITADGVAGLAGCAVAGSLLAAVLAAMLSPVTLFGPVLAAQPGRPAYLDWTVLGLGSLALAAVLALAALAASWRQAPRRRAARRAARPPQARVLRAAAGAGLPAPAVCGLRFALEPGRGSTSVPVRSVLAGAVLASLIGTATLIFGASLGALVGHPSLYGWNFSDALYATGGWGPIPPVVTRSLLAADRSVAATTGAYFLTVQVDGQTVPAMAVPPGSPIEPAPLTGSRLRRSGQIVLGPGTLAQLGKRVGDTVELTQGAGPGIRPVRLTIAGTAALPAIGTTLSIHPTMADGAVYSTALLPPQETQEFGPLSGPNAIFVRLRPGTSTAAGYGSLRRIALRITAFEHSPQVLAKFGPDALQVNVTALPPQRPAEIVNYKTMGAMPAVLAGGLAAGAVAALAVTLAASVRRRRRDLALLKTLGFTRGQLAAAVGWQATTIAALGLVVGVPLGVAAGRWLWLAFARELSAVPQPVIPTASLALAMLAALVLANVVAALPGRSAARTRPGEILRAE